MERVEAGSQSRGKGYTEQNRTSDCRSLCLVHGVSLLRFIRLWHHNLFVIYGFSLLALHQILFCPFFFALSLADSDSSSAGQFPICVEHDRFVWLFRFPTHLSSPNRKRESAPKISSSWFRASKFLNYLQWPRNLDFFRLFLHSITR